jgi:tetratricopeptide (TPR) repeat protein
MADELRLRGNAAYSSKNFEEAIKLYDEALQADPKSTDVLNNRSAANFALGRYDAAVEDAKRSIKVSSNSKGFVRMADAYWKMGKLELARDTYELALSAGPNNQAAKEKLIQVRALIAPKTSGATYSQQTSGTAGGYAGGASDLIPLYLDALVLLMCILHIITMFVNGSISLLLWRGALLTFAARQLVILRAAGMLTPNLETLKKWPGHFSSLYAVLCLLGAFLGVPPLHLLLAAMAMYSVVDLAPHAAKFQGKVPPLLFDRVQPLLAKAAASREILTGNAATCEAMLTFMLLFSGSSMIFNLAYIQFIKFRFRSDAFSRMAFTALRQSVERLTKHSMCPPIIDRGFSKACDLLHRVGTS